MSELSSHNQEQLFRLVAAIEDNQGVMSPLIAVCDDNEEGALRDHLIAQCEQDLEEGIEVYRVALNQEEPSLRLGVGQYIEREPRLLARQPGVLMVEGAEKLLFVARQGKRTGIDKFMGYLQWGREGLTAFPYPIVLWITERIYGQMINLTDSVRALDFWSWRRGVFQFENEPIKRPIEKSKLPVKSINSVLKREIAKLSFQELQDRIVNLEQNNPQTPQLGVLYNRLGQFHHQQLRQGNAQDFAQVECQAHACFDRAIALQQDSGLIEGLVASFRHQGQLYFDSGKSTEAIGAYKMSLTWAQGVEDQQGEASALKSLGDVHFSRGQYGKANNLYGKSLEITREIGEQLGETASLNGLGNTFHYLGKHQEAIDHHQQSLQIARETDNPLGEANALVSLGNTHHILGEYQMAINLHNQCLEVAQRVNDRQREAGSLGNLGNAHHALGQYQEAIACYKQQLHIAREIGAQQEEANALGGLGLAYRRLREYQTAIAYHQRHLKIAQRMSDRQGAANASGSLGNAYHSLGEHQKAIAFHKQHFKIAQSIGDLHGQFAALFNMASPFISLNNRLGARHNYEQALTLAQRMGLDHRIKQCQDALAQLF